MAMQKRFVVAALVIAAILMMATVLALLQSTKTVPSSGTIYAFKVAVYTDETASNPVFKVNWTTVNPGGSDTEDVYVKNEAGSLSMNLSMTTSGWSATPSNTTLVASLSWNATGTVLSAGTGTWARLTLAVEDNLETQTGLDFSVNINVIGDEV